MSYKFFITDVFTDTQYKGNQLATVILDSEISTEKMQSIAKEFNFSETTFVIRPKVGSSTYDVRIFTPADELPFAGHPTLGTAYLMRQEFNNTADSVISLNLPIGTIPVEFETDLLWMTQKPAEYGEFFLPSDVSQLLHVPEEEVRTDIPIQVINTGIPSVIIPLKTLAAVKSARTDRSSYDKFFRGKKWATLYLFSEETYHPENQVNARVFCDIGNIAEDPATGSATGCLGGYLHKYTNSDINTSIEQGFEIGRESILKLRVNNGIIKVGGQVVVIAKGELI